MNLSNPAFHAGGGMRPEGIGLIAGIICVFIVVIAPIFIVWVGEKLRKTKDGEI